ncbi:unnamed protein product [Symbiodinium necroappetens]|uniref:CCHC-type domain-containing protein n=1 Tax=Symbiodinium necroappetens TaxID=1628268 RepID=A0A813ACJ1_9DINO|nr:unnamed protein product [Symbiodinium necroappetens]
MADSHEKSTVPSWDGQARLVGPARLLAMSWSQMDFDSSGGTKLLLRRLASSPLVRRTLPNAAAICQQYFSFRRQPAESIGNFLVRETLVHEEFVEAIIRLHEEKLGVAQDMRDFGLPDDSEWEQSWWEGGSWGGPADHGDDDYQDADLPGDRPVPDGDPPTSTGAGQQDHRDDSALPRGATGSSPSHRPGDSGSQAGSKKGDSGDAKVPLDELSIADSFIMDVLRGWRLLQAAGLNADEKRDILSTTKNSLDYTVISTALQSLWDDQLLGNHRHHPSSYNAHLVDAVDDHMSYQHEMSDWWDDDGWGHDWWYEDAYADHHDDTWWEHEWPQEAQTMNEAPADPELAAKLQEAQQAERVAESLAAEATRTWSEAQRATQALRRDRGFGLPSNASAGKCFICGGNHFARECPDRAHQGGKGGKGYHRNYMTDMDENYAYYFFKGKTKGKYKGKSKKGMAMEAQAWMKGRSKAKGKGVGGKDGLRSLNAYSSEFFLGGLEVSEVLEAAASHESSSSPGTGMIDCGATASAAPEAVVRGLISAVLTQDRGAKIELEQSARPYFRFGNGRWGRALCRVHLSSQVSGGHQHFSLYALPNPDNYYQDGLSKSSLVPVLIGMDYLGPHGVGMMIDFASGLAMNTKDTNPEPYRLQHNHKGHYVLDIVHHLTKGCVNHEGTIWLDMTVRDAEFDEQELSAARDRMWRLYVAALLAESYRAKAAKAKAKSRPRSFDAPRRMKADPRDPRTQPSQWPCFGRHRPSAPEANPHGQWVTCSVCNLRLLYTPRKGSPANSTQTMNAPMVLKMLEELRGQLGNVKPTAKVCLHAMNKLTAEAVLEKSTKELLENPNTTPSTPSTSTAWGMIDDEELVAAYENETK